MGNYWGCRSTYSFGSPSFHVKVEYGNDGKFTITRDGQQISGDGLDPPASGNDWGILKSNYESKGGVIYSSQWTGSWVPADFWGCRARPRTTKVFRPTAYSISFALAIAKY